VKCLPFFLSCYN